VAKVLWSKSCGLVPEKASKKDLVVTMFKILAKFAAIVGGLYVAFTFVFHFGDLQALGLALVIAIATDWASSRKPPQQASFTPHRLGFQFYLYPMLKDLGLTDSEEQWKALIGEAPSARVWDKKSVYHHSVSAWVIGTDPRLIHYPALQFYTGEFKFDIKLEDLPKVSSQWTWHPDVFVGPGLGSEHSGYHIGIRVNERWWESQKSSVAPGVVLHEDKEWNFGTVRLTLAVLPWEITHVYYREVGRNHQAGIKALIGKLGWTNEELGGPEIGYFGESYEHKYASVWAQHLD
jgi:hypothetical protein